MMDRTDSFSRSIGCDAAVAERVHEGTATYFARVRCNAIFAGHAGRLKREHPATSALEMGVAHARFGPLTAKSRLSRISTKADHRASGLAGKEAVDWSCFREFREGVVLCCEHRNLAVNRFLGNKRLDREFFHD
jgi:hypothetical protein